MSNPDFKVVYRDDEVLNLLQRLDPKSRKEDFREALRKGADYIAGQTEVNLLRKPIHNSESLAGGIIQWDEADYLAVAVSITGDYRLNFFENGTDDRSLRRGGKRRQEGGRDANKQYPMGANRGRIDKAKFGGFFADAVSDKEAIRREIIREMKLLIPSDR